MKENGKKSQWITLCFLVFLLMGLFPHKSISQNLDSLAFYEVLFGYKHIYGVLKVKFEQNDTTYFMISKNMILLEMLEMQPKYQKELKNLGYKNFMLKYTFLEKPLLLANVPTTFRRIAKRIYFLKEDHIFSPEETIKRCIHWTKKENKRVFNRHNYNPPENYDLWNIGSVHFGVNCPYKKVDLILWFYRKNILLLDMISPSYLSIIYQVEKKN